MIYAMFFVAIYGFIISNNLIKKIMCLNIIQSLVILSFMLAAHSKGTVAPVISDIVEKYADPLPHSLMITAVVVGVCFNCIALSIIVKLYYKKKTVLVNKLKGV